MKDLSADRQRRPKMEVGESMSERKVLILCSGWKISTTLQPPLESGAGADEQTEITGPRAGKRTRAAG